MEQDGFPKGLCPFGGVQRQSLWEAPAPPENFKREIGKVKEIKQHCYTFVTFKEISGIFVFGLGGR